jgi:hypothetical protein
MSDALIPDEKKMSPVPVDWETFLATSPPSSWVIVAGAFELKGTYAGYYQIVLTPIKSYCESEHCGGERFFDPLAKELPYGDGNPLRNYYLEFRCRHCHETRRAIAFLACRDQANKEWAYKLGEYPVFGPHIPSKAITLIRGDKELFLKGHRAESQGMGIAAFAYYRRVIDSQKNRLLDEIIRVSEHLGAKPEIISDLSRAKIETRFTVAIESIKPAIPDVLLINGQNPLTLLYAALSDGLHNQSDEECLELAQSIRTVLFELADRLGVALKENNEIKKAVGRLTQQRPGQSPKSA